MVSGNPRPKPFEMDHETLDPNKLDSLKNEHMAILRETHDFFQRVRKDESDETGKETSGAWTEEVSRNKWFRLRRIFIRFQGGSRRA